MCETEKTCKNCRYYMQHFVRSKAKFKSTCFGHFIKKVSTVGSAIRLTSSYCDMWEEAEMENTEDIEKILKLMVKQIEEISVILKLND